MLTTNRTSRTALACIALLLASATPSAAVPAYYTGTGHYYELVATALSWPDARDAAAARTYNPAGTLYKGYLVTIESADEQQFLATTFATPGTGYIPEGWGGGLDAGHEGDWQWVTGPYADTPATFWKNGRSVLYTNWKAGEPNNSNSVENYLELGFGTLSWNDIGIDGVPRYYVEYAPVPEPAPAALALLCLPLWAAVAARTRARRNRARGRPAGS